MPKYQISTVARMSRTYEVEADNEDEARMLWRQGGIDPVDECDDDEYIDEIEELTEKDELPNCVWRDAETPFADNH